MPRFLFKICTLLHTDMTTKVDLVIILNLLEVMHVHPVPRRVVGVDKVVLEPGLPHLQHVVEEVSQAGVVVALEESQPGRGHLVLVGLEEVGVAEGPLGQIRALVGSLFATEINCRFL